MCVNDGEIINNVNRSATSFWENQIHLTLMCFGSGPAHITFNDCVGCSVASSSLQQLVEPQVVCERSVKVWRRAFKSL